MIATYENISTYLIDLAVICQYFKYVDDTSCGNLWDMSTNFGNIHLRLQSLDHV